MGKHYVGEEGTQIILETSIDVTAASVKAIKVLKPGATEEVSWEADDLETTKLAHTLEAGDFNVAGMYRFQTYVELGGQKVRGETFEKYIFEKFES